VLVLVEDGAITETTRGTFEGRVAFTPRGKGGFGYDPIFEPLTEEPGGRTVAELSPDEKNRVSHRALAAMAMRERLIARGY
jgi:XTP/dITP diphosphohydrolase